MKHRNPWPMGLVALVALFLLLTLWSVRQAGQQGSSVAERDYYEQGLRYSAAVHSRDLARELGWQAQTSLRERSLRTRLMDHAGKPVSGCSAEIIVRTNGASPLRLALQETEPGLYQAMLPEELTSSEILVAVTLRKDGAAFEKRLLLQLS